jgi:type VI secretion system protein VasI
MRGIVLTHAPRYSMMRAPLPDALSLGSLETTALKTISACAIGVVLLGQHASAQATKLQEPIATRWKIALSKSPMDDSRTVVLSLTADASVPVWLKSVTPMLVLRCKERILDTYVVTNTAAMVESSDYRTVRLRFDGATAERQGWPESNDHSALFAPEPEVFLDRLRKTSKLIFQFEPFNAAPVIVGFHTGGLNSRISQLLAACPETTKTQAQRVAERKRTNPLASDLIGATETAVTQQIGRPHYIDGHRWTFDLPDGHLLIYFNNGLVDETSPADARLTTVLRRSESPEETPKAIDVPRQPSPPGAVAKCGDGLFVFSSSGDDTCKGHGGVAEWLK